MGFNGLKLVFYVSLVSSGLSGWWTREMMFVVMHKVSASRSIAEILRISDAIVRCARSFVQACQRQYGLCEQVLNRTSPVSDLELAESCPRLLLFTIEWLLHVLTTSNDSAAPTIGRFFCNSFCTAWRHQKFCLSFGQVAMIGPTQSCASH